jgi:hypothetical protein
MSFFFGVKQGREKDYYINSAMILTPEIVTGPATHHVVSRKIHRMLSY